MNCMTPGYKELRELLANREAQGRDRTLYEDAAEEITSLRETSCTQSTNLAEALKLKNDSLVANVRTIQNLEHARDQNLALVQENRNLRLSVETLGRLNAQLIESEQNLAAELARYKPLEPKFRVGQVIVCKNAGVDREFAVKLAAVNLASYGVAGQPPIWQYTDTVGRIWNAESLRPLTDDEK